MAVAGADLAGRLADVVRPEHVIAEPDRRASYETDWTRRFSGAAACVVRPGSTAEVAAVVRACAEAGAAIVPQGGNTGLVGGSVPRGGEVVLSLARLDELGPVDEAAAQVTAGAGVTLAALHEHARRADLAFAVDFAARDTATVGGMVATNAGGEHVLRYGGTRAQLVGIEAVLADGRVVERMAGLLKDNAGYDLVSLLCGSEGTLGVVTRARLRLVRRLPERVTALFAVDDAAAAIDLFTHLRRALPSLEAAELFFADGLRLVCEEMELSPPFAEEHPAYLLVECADVRDPVEDLAATIEAGPAVRDEAVAQDTARREALWAYREHHTEAIGRRGVPHKLDVSVPIARLAEFVARVSQAVDAAVPRTRTILFGHAGDGNLHVNLLGPGPGDERADEAVLRLVAEVGGSVSAEHGVGVAKARWLGLTRSQAEIDAMRAIKRALDPQGILNPGVLFPPP